MGAAIETYVTASNVLVVRQNWTVINGASITAVEAAQLTAWPTTFDTTHVVKVRTDGEWVELVTGSLFEAVGAVERIEALLGWNAPTDDGAIAISTTVAWEQAFVDEDTDTPSDPTH